MTSCCAPTCCQQTRILAVEHLYIDLSTCDRCQGAEQALAEAVAEAAPVLASLGIEVRVVSRLVADAAQAQAVRLATSPTIRVDGRDIQPQFGESGCAACGDLAGGGPVDCREWSWRGNTFTAPPKGLILEALLRAALDGPGAVPQPDPEPYRLPDNLAAFFAGRKPAAPAPCGCA